MADIRVSVSMHFTFDPAKQFAKIPEEITKTIAIGEAIIPAKVPGAALSGETGKTILMEMEKLVAHAQKKAKPAKAATPEAKPADKAGEQGSLL
jgi:hypothetical protein